MTGQPNGVTPTVQQPCTLRIDSPVGVLVLKESGGAIVAVDWRKPGRSGASEEASAARDSGGTTPLLAEAARQIGEYFAGRRQDFDLPLSPAGSDFHQSVWRLMLAIPFGQTASYGELAKRLNCPAQPVGGACGANPIPILIPCHRVVAANGLGGFSGGGGLESKRFLLHHESALEPELDLF